MFLHVLRVAALTLLINQSVYAAPATPDFTDLANSDAVVLIAPDGQRQALRDPSYGGEVKFGFTGNGAGKVVSAQSGRFVESLSSTFSAKFSYAEERIASVSGVAAIHFGRYNPTSGYNLCLIRLQRNGSHWVGSLKGGFSGNKSHPDYLALPEAESLAPQKLPDGKWVLMLPRPLPPGEYAIVGYELDWLFRVPATATD